MVVEHDKKSKEEMIKCEEQCKIERIGERRNIVLQDRNRMWERRVREMIKTVDSMRNLDGHMQKIMAKTGYMLIWKEEIRLQK